MTVYKQIEFTSSHFQLFRTSDYSFIVGPVSSFGRVQVVGLEKSKDLALAGSAAGSTCTAEVGDGPAYVALKLKGEYHAYIQIKMYAPEKVNAKKKRKDYGLFYWKVTCPGLPDQWSSSKSLVHLQILVVQRSGQVNLSSAAGFVNEPSLLMSEPLP